MTVHLEILPKREYRTELYGERARLVCVYVTQGERGVLAPGGEAEHVTRIDVATLIKASRVDLADSALHAPQAGFDDTDFYPDPDDKAAVLAMAAREVDEAWLADWLRERVTFRT